MSNRRPTHTVKHVSQESLFCMQARRRILQAIPYLHGASSDLHTADPRGANPAIVAALEKVTRALAFVRDANEQLTAASR